MIEPLENDGGIIDQYRQRAQCPCDWDSRLPVGFAGDIQMYIQSAIAQFVGECLAGLIEHVGDQYFGAVFNQQPNRRLSHAARSACDDCYFAR